MELRLRLGVSSTLLMMMVVMEEGGGRIDAYEDDKTIHVMHTQIPLSDREATTTRVACVHRPTGTRSTLPADRGQPALPALPALSSVGRGGRQETPDIRTRTRTAHMYMQSYS